MVKITKGSIYRKKDPLEFAADVRRELEGAMRTGRYVEELRNLGTLFPPHDEHIQKFLRNPMEEWLSREDIPFLCGELCIEESAFYLDRDHGKFLTRMNKDLTRGYDPMTGTFTEQPTQPILENPIHLTVSPDLINGYLNRRMLMPPSAKYSIADYLVEVGYTKRMSYTRAESPLERLGRIQFDNVNCIPLTLYAALHSGKPVIVKG